MFGERYSDAVRGVHHDERRARGPIFEPNLPGDEDIGSPAVTDADVPERGTVLFTTGATDERHDLSRPGQARSTTADGEIVAWVWAIPIDDVEDTINSLMLVEILGSIAILAALGSGRLVGRAPRHPPGQGDDRRPPRRSPTAT